MKRLIVLLVVLLMASTAVAEGMNLSSMTYDELSNLQKDINKEMAKRPEQNGYAFPAGIFYSGCGIPDGIYVLTCSYGGGAAYIYKSYESFVNGEKELNRAWITSGNSYSMNIQGNVCYVIEFPSYLTPFDWIEN